MTQSTKTKNQILAVIITIAALLTGANAWSASKFTIEKSGNSFVIKRSSDVGSETVYYRTVGLSAIHGQHFTSINGSFTFKDGKKESPLITVEEITPKIAAFYFQEDYTRQYRFEVLNEGGFQVASTDRTMTIGSKVTKDAFNIKDVTVNSGTITVTDGGYSQDYHAVPLEEYYTKAAAKDYLVAAGAELCMTLTFQAKESDDGYQHLQILVNRPKIPKVTNYDTGAGDNNPGKIQYSNYMACFVHEGGKKNSSYANYSFPVLSVGATSSAVSGAWSDINSTNDVGELRCQKFNVGCRATDGRLIVCSKNALKDLSYLGIRFDASGEFGDTWTANNTEAHIQAIDKTAPTMLYDYITVSRGRHSKGNTIYVSVPFSEIVTVYGSTNQTYLNTSWGRLYYYNGKGSNVLTFAGTINTNATGTFSIKGYEGTIKDQKDNIFNGSISKDFDISLDPNHTFSISYDLAGGNLSSPNPTTYDYETPTFTLNNPTKFGNVFQGWKEANRNTPRTTLTITKGSNGHLSYTAQWTQNPYTVRFHKNDGTDETADEVFAYGTAQQLDEPFTRTGYSFTGWSETPDGAVVYTAGQEVNNLTSIANEVIDLYAQWSVHTYTVHFDANGGSGTMSDMTFTYGQEQTLTPNAFTKESHRFTGWNTQADGEGTAYANGQNVSNLTSDDDVTVTLYAQWKINDDLSWTGSGTQDDPFVITTPEGLDFLARCVNGGNYFRPFSFRGCYFKLGADIDYNYDAPWYKYDYLENNYTPIGSYYNYDKTGFEGIFDGNYKTISGIRIKNQYRTDEVGLFGYVGPGGIVKNVTLSDACIVGVCEVGGIAGVIDESAMIDNCHVTNTVAICSAQYDGQVFGGITGYNNYGIINGCTSAANIGEVYPPYRYVGGVVGYNRGVLMNSTAIDANVNSFDYVGGVVGGNTGILQHCHTVRTRISGTNFVGAICGADAFTFYNKQEGFPPVANYYCDCSVMFKNSVKTYEIGCGNSDVPPFDIPDYDGAVPAIILYDDDKNPNLEQKNTDIVASCNSYEGNVVVYGRTLWKDGGWNTLCLPFDVTAEQLTVPQNPLYGAIIKELDNESSYEGHQTGLAGDGTLRLYFKTATSIEAGKPYLVRWSETTSPLETIYYLGRYYLPWYEGTEFLNDPFAISAFLGEMFNYPLLSENPNYAAQAPSSDIFPLKSIVNPAFSGVTVSSTTPTAVSFAGGKFVGNYSSVSFGANDKSILFLGAENKLYWPSTDMTLNACRAYFDLGTNEARQFVLHFDGEEDNTTGIAPLLSPEGDDAGASPRGGLVGASWYDLQGRRLSQKPTKAGMYIHGQKKVMIK